MKILLCSSYFLTHHTIMQNEPHLYPPLGPLYIAAYIRKSHNWDIEFYDSTFSPGEEHFAEFVQSTRPNIVGIQSFITTRKSSQSMIQAAKQSGAIVIVGGPDPSTSCQDYLTWGADFVVIGEGEITILELLKNLQHREQTIESIAGIAYKNGHEVIINEPRAPICDLDTIPFPAYDLIDLNPYFELWKSYHRFTELQVITSRGCPFNCTWCSKAVFGQTFRQRSVANVIDEMVFLRDTFGIERLWIADDTFGLNKSWLKTWCQEVKQRQLELPFKCMTRANLITRDSLQDLQHAGCYQIHLGVESGSQRILDAMKKGTNVQQIRKAASLVHDSGIELGCFIMFGYPGERVQDIQQTRRLIRELKPDNLGVSIAYPVPGTEFYDSVKSILAEEIEELWDEVSSGYKLLFNAEFSEKYYTNLIRYIFNRLSLQRSSRLRKFRISILFYTLLSYLIVKIFEIKKQATFIFNSEKHY